MVLESASSKKANDASKTYREQIRAIATLNGLRATQERGNRPIRLAGTCKPWASFPQAFQGAELGVPILFSGWGDGQFKDGLGIQPILQTERGNGYQNVMFRTLFLANAYPFPIAIIADGGAFSGYTEPAYFYRWMKDQAANMPSTKNIAFIGSLSEFRGFMVSEVGLIDLQSEVA